MPAILSKEYWEKRSELNLIRNEKSASQYERQLKKAYEETIRSIRKEVQAFYQRHSDETGVTLTSARRRLKPEEQMDFQKQARKYLDEVERLGDKAFTAEYRGYLKKLSGRAYISQMDELVTNIRHNIETLSTGYNTGLGNTLKDAYETEYFSTMFDAQKQAGVGVSFTAPGGKQLETAIREKWLGQNYSDRIWTDKKKLTNNIEQMLSQEFVRGRGPNDIARDFADRLNVSYSNAQRLIRTEINYISNKGSLQAYKDTGIVEKYRYLATLDSRTSDICRELDGEVFEIKEAKVGVNLPPLHPYCRSTTVPHFDDDDIGELIEDRIARDDDGTGKSIRLGENLKFFDWVEKYGSESFKKKVTAQRAKFKGMDMASSITEALVADEMLKGIHDRLSKQNFTETQIKEVQDYVSKLTGEEQKKWADAIKSTTYDIGDESVSAHYSPDKHTVYLANGDNAETIFHETAHALDEGSIHKVMFEGESYEFTIGKASGYLQERMDYGKKGSDFVSFCKAIGTKVNEDGSWFGEEGIDVFQKYNAWAKETVKVYGKQGFDSVSDIFSGITQDEIGSSLLWGGHSKDYWQRPVTGNMAFMSYTEAWADFSTLKATKNEPMLSLLKEIIPNQYEILEEIYSEVFK